MDLLFYVLLEIALILCFILFWRFIRESNLKKLEANQRANELLRSVLTSEQYKQLTRNGFLISPVLVIQNACTACHERRAW
jgi:hypothetical protein